MTFVAKFEDSKILKRLRINPVDWRWNSVPKTILAGLLNRSGADGI